MLFLLLAPHASSFFFPSSPFPSLAPTRDASIDGAACAPPILHAPSALPADLLNRHHPSRLSRRRAAIPRLARGAHGDFLSKQNGSLESQQVNTRVAAVRRSDSPAWVGLQLIPHSHNTPQAHASIPPLTCHPLP